MPVDASSFPEEVQVAFFIYGHLSDKWEFQTGVYLGKEWNELEYLFKLYEVDNPKVILQFMKMYETMSIQKSAKESKQRHEQEKRQAGSDGKTYTHNIRG